MADNLTTQSSTLATVPASTVIATDDVSGVHYQLVKLAFGVLDTATLVSTSNGLPVNVLNATLAATQSGTWTVTGTGGTFPVTDSGGSLTVDAPVGTPVFVRLSDGSSAIATLPVSLASLPARTATADAITAKLATDTIQNGTTALTPKYAAISASSSGNNTIVAAVVGKKIRVLRFHLLANGAVNAKFTDGAGGSDLTGLHYFAAAGGGVGAAFCPVGLFETSSNTALVLNLSGAVAVGGVLTYVEV